MADPFDVQLPAQMRLPPVDMSGMKYVGSNVASWFQGNSAMEMQKARLGLEFEQVRSRIETQKMDNLVKRMLLQEKTQADLWTAEFLAENRFDPAAILKATPSPDRISNAGFGRAVMNLKRQAALTLASDARAHQKIGFDSELENTIRAGDRASSLEAGALFDSVNENGWTSENVAALSAIRGGLNERLAAQKAASRQGVLPADVQLLEFAEQYRLSGEEAKAVALESVVKEHGRNKGQPQKIDKSVTATTEDLTTGTKVTRKMTEEEFARSEASKPPVLDEETKKQLSEYAEEKAAISAGDKAKGPDWLGLSDRARHLKELKTKLIQKGIDADTGSRIGAATVTTTAPPAQSEIELRPDDPTKRVIGKRYRSASGREATWTESGWQE